MIKIDVSKSVTTRLPLEPKKDSTGGWLNNGLVCARLINIFMSTEEHTQGEYQGLQVPVLNFEFQNFKVLDSDPDTFLLHREKVVGTKQKQGDSYTNLPEDKVEKNTIDLWGRIKHILDACSVLPQGVYRDIAQIPAELLDEYFALPSSGTPEERIAAFGKMFQFICDFANGDSTIAPMYRTAEGLGCLMWLKLLPAYPNGNKYEIPSWVKTGFAEGTRIDKTTNMPVAAKILQVRPNESLELIAAPKPGAGAANIPGVNASIPTGGGDNSALNYLRGKTAQ